MRIKSFFGLVIIGLLYGCEVGSPSGNAEEKNSRTAFNLHADHLMLREKLPEGDTILFVADLSICMYEGYELNKIYKEQGNLCWIVHRTEFTDTLHTITFGPQIDTGSNCPDMLLLHSFLAFLDCNNSEPQSRSGPRFMLIYNLDTLNYYSYGLANANQLTIYYSLLKECIFAETAYYGNHLIAVPPPPKTD